MALPEHETKLVPVPEWGGDIRIKVLEMPDLAVMRERCNAGGKYDGALFDVLLLHYCIVEPALSEDEIRMLRDRPTTTATTWQRISDAINEFSALTANGRVSEAAFTAAAEKF
jgi:hypothetical protein